jgi:hypothetical protein
VEAIDETINFIEAVIMATADMSHEHERWALQAVLMAAKTKAQEARSLADGSKEMP